MITINALDDFKALDPFFRIIEKGLPGLVDGNFFDLLAEDVVFDYIITTPGYPRHVEGRQAVAGLPPVRRHGRPWTGATISLSITTPAAASWCSSTPRRRWEASH